MSRNFHSRLNKLSLRRRVLVFTEGKTERDYLKRFKSKRQTGISIKTQHISRSKLALIQKIVRLTQKKHLQEGDTVWAVLDRDEDKDRNLFQQAIDLAEKEDIRLAYSNNSFEVWPLLHFQSIQKAMNNNELLAALQKHLGEKCRKRGGWVYETLAKKGDYATAQTRADKLLEKHAKDGVEIVDANPSTTIHRLIQILKDPTG